MDEQVSQPSKLQLTNFALPLAIGVICAVVLVVCALFISPTSNWKLVYILAIALPMMWFICICTVVGSILTIAVGLAMLFVKSKRKLAVQLIISSLCTSIPISGAWFLTGETQIGQIIKHLPRVENTMPN